MKNDIEINDQCIVNSKNVIWFILFIGFLLRILVLISYGNKMYLYSDDVNYIHSAIDFIKSGHITYYHKNNATVFCMPGMILLLSGIFKITGYGEFGLFLARFAFVIIGVVTIYGVYLIAKIIFNLKTANLSALLVALYLPYIAINNIFLTETPSIFCFVFLTYFLLKYCQEHSDKNFILIIVFYLLGILFKPTIGIYPVAFLPLMIYKRISIKELFIKGIYTILIVVIFLSPWWIRNYKVTGEFIPFTGNQGDTLLLGTFEGVGYPEGTYANEIKEIIDNANKRGDTHVYYRFKDEGIVAKERINQWLNNNPKAFLYTYLIFKPLKILKGQYYPIMIFNFGNNIIYFTYYWYIIFAFLGVLGLFFKSRDKDELVSLICLMFGILISIYMSSSFAALPRYGMSIIPIVLIFTACGLEQIKLFLFKTKERWLNG